MAFDPVEARRLYDAGIGRNQIAKRLKCGAAVITRWAQREGLSFDRAQTAVAVKARSVDIAAARTLLTQKTLALALATEDELEGPWLVWSFGGRDNTYEEHILDRAPIGDRRIAVAMARDAHMMASKTLEMTDSVADEAAKSLMTAMARQFGLIPETVEAPE